MDGTKIASHTCGTIPAYSDIRKTLTGTFTAPTTGPYTFKFNNWRNDVQTTDIKNYVDNIRFAPQTPNFSCSPRHLSASTGGSSTFTLDAGPAYAGKDYVIFSGVTGTYPGFTWSGVHVPLNLDTWTWTAFSLINTAVMQNFMAALDANGQATAVFAALAPLPPEAVGLALYFDYVVLKNPGSPPVVFASHPLYVLFIP